MPYIAQAPDGCARPTPSYDDPESAARALLAPSGEGVAYVYDHQGVLCAIFSAMQDDFMAHPVPSRPQA